MLQERTAATNGIVKVEILSGARDGQQFRDYAETLGSIHQLPVDEDTWLLAARLGYGLRRTGIVVSTPDLVIAASAIQSEAVLVHADSDFDRIAESSDLRVESYAGAGV